VLTAAAVLLTGCGSSSRRVAKRGPPAVCAPAARTATASSLSVAPGTIAASTSTGNNGSPQCTFKAQTAAGARVRLVANVNSGPQPYFILERTAIEASQQFGTGGFSNAAVPVSGLGIDAYWFAGTTQLMSTDGVRLITVTVSWHGVTQRQRRALATAVSRTYLRARKHGQANGFPSG
jgi:hypothetical protein